MGANVASPRIEAGHTEPSQPVIHSRPAASEEAATTYETHIPT